MKSWLVIALLIIVGGTVIRLYDLGQLPAGLYWDEVAMLVDAKSVAQTGMDMHSRPWYQVLYISYGDFKLPAYIWLASASVKVFGVSEWALRLPSAIAGVMTIIVGGLIARELSIKFHSGFKVITDKSVAHIFALTTMLTLAVSPWSVLFSRTAFEGHLAQLLVAMSVFFLLRSHHKSWYLMPAVILGGVATYAYFSVRFVWPVVFLASQLFLGTEVWLTPLRQKKWLSSILVWARMFVLPLVFFGLLLIPMMRSPLYSDSNKFRYGTDSILNNEKQVLQSNVYREKAGNTPLDRIIFHRYWLTGRELLKNYADHVSLNFLFLSGDSNLRHGTGVHGLFLLSFLPFFIWGHVSMWAYHKRWWFFLVCWWLVAVLPAAVPENTPHALRSLNALMPVSLIIGWGMSSFYAWLKKLKLPGWFKTQIALLVLFILTINSLFFLYYYFTVYPQVSAQHWQYGYREVASSIYSIREGTPVYISAIDDRFYLWLMAYGPYTGTDFQSWQSKAYMFNDFDTIFYKEFPGWDQVYLNSSMVVIVGPTEHINRVMKSQAGEVVKKEVVMSPSGQELYTVALLKHPR